ncbi:MAG: hypothetical protein ACKPKO_41195, partial [Candidatus Fonsibacter sp.]
LSRENLLVEVEHFFSKSVIPVTDVYLNEVARTLYSALVSPISFSSVKDSRHFGTLGGPRFKKDIDASPVKGEVSVELLAVDVAPVTSAEADT